MREVRRQQGEDLAHAHRLDHRRHPEDREEDAPILRGPKRCGPAFERLGDAGRGRRGRPGGHLRKTTGRVDVAGQIAGRRWFGGRRAAAGGWRLAPSGWRLAPSGWPGRVAPSGWPSRVASCGGRFDKPRPQPAGTEAPEGTGGDLRSTGPVAANKSTVSGRRRVPRSLALRPANLVPGTVSRIAPRTSLAVQPAPSGKTKCTTQGRATTMRLSTNISRYAPDLSPNLSPMWTGCGYTHGGGVTWVV